MSYAFHYVIHLSYPLPPDYPYVDTIVLVCFCFHHGLHRREEIYTVAAFRKVKSNRMCPNKPQPVLTRDLSLPSFKIVVSGLGKSLAFHQ
jgi:hypothetical protein